MANGKMRILFVRIMVNIVPSKNNRDNREIGNPSAAIDVKLTGIISLRYVNNFQYSNTENSSRETIFTVHQI